ncbi:MAG: 3-phosphoshikimate 1-carboxyvinyltransferase [Methanobrevibacter sp.]|jgi:3-phosphoshikimate 1-carboxyvinyltransferase|nr:3-phosphoshikimate 1-carboxyvinyltransferase [Methanobrevibacter sp.]
MILKVKNLKNVGGVVKAPPSKSYTHRAVIIASLANGYSKLFDPLVSEDTLSSIKACEAFGAEIAISNKGGEETAQTLDIEGTTSLHNYSKEAIDLMNSGTTLRIMTSVAGLADNETIFTGDDSLKTRPMEMLLEAIKPLGGNARSIPKNGKPPIAIKPGFIGGKTAIDGSVSSQFISSILIAGAISKKGINLEVKGDFISKSYVAMTLDVMEKFGIIIETDLFTKHEDCDIVDKKCFSTYFSIKPQKYMATDYVVEGDYSSASYLLGAIAILGGEIKIKNLFKDSKQGDKFILDILKQMGAKIEIAEDFVTLKSNGNLKGIAIDLHNAPDLLPTVSVLASLATGTTTITGVKHARYKETDRIAKCAEELKKLGCELEEKDDGMVIKGGIHSGKVKSHDDHRIAMAFTLAGLKHEIAIENGNVFDVSFPNFIEAMKEIGIELELLE